MVNRDSKPGKTTNTISVRERGEAFNMPADAPRKKFATQMDAELLEQLRRYAKSEGRQIQAVLEDAVRDMLKEKRGYQMRPDVKAAHDQIVKRYAKTFEALAK